ncbi:hypothetical protein NCLIV_039430 [Neospora caninum Liverpool]|uniref:Uncharacterized protein n=1 Tax=Neospora caninum (strain Liverpool) TaxID=572307 RepID=F0VB46_NEOCL|nr:hypothetical protein NCLIV_039430 [Neospora caninum Liverpool]CBZ50868.1 hypothetical protein NCLIV_039430 [Neospora caninum Liverpool]|eukprot:XP_003880901.1 hypothetical protein NCLIV_039430 [Neospora caninum Liverpool]
MSRFRAETVPPKRHDDDNDFNDDDRGNNVDDRDDNDDNDNDEQHYLFISTDERHAKRSWYTIHFYDRSCDKAAQK